MSILNGKTTLLMIGAGNMGEAMLRSWVQTQISKFSLLVLEPQPSDWLKSMFEMGLVDLNNIKTENEILKEIEKLRTICTFLIISHRTNLKKYCNKFFVLNGGKLNRSAE